MSLYFLQLFSCNWYLVVEDSWYDFNFLNLLRFDLWTKMWSILENVPSALEKVYSSAFGWNVLKISRRSISSNVSVKTYVSLWFSVLMLCPLVWVGCSSLLLLLCYCQFLLLCLLVFVLCIEVLLCWGHRYLQLLCLPLGLIPVNTILTFIINIS